MEIPNYDFNEDENTNFKQLYNFMPKSNFRMLICGNSGSGKTNLLYHILMKPLVYYDQIHLYGKNLEQEKYRHMIETKNNISSQVGYDVMHCNNDDINPVNSLESDAQKIVTFDDFICDKIKSRLSIISFKAVIRTVLLFTCHNHFIKHQKISD
ncbi:unnamed protein product [Porites evermanni]|uniref:Uncharacterized protein n=1 Tax=Porites evermanni TaxID=104178 RepID=A0ABN8RVI1_9CNID|nr:unnamed protein product [Porites evermanni]